MRVLLPILIFIAGSCFGQPYIDVVNIRLEQFPEQRYKERPDATQQSTWFEGTILLPFVLKNENTFLLGGHYRKIAFKSTGTEEGSTSLNSIALQSGYEFVWKEKKWHALTMLLSRMNYDYFEEAKNKFQLGGLVLFKYQMSEKLRLHAGLYYNREFFGNYFVPLLGLDWKLNDRINVFGNMPATMNIEYRLDSSTYIGFSYWSIKNTYRIADPDEKLYVHEGNESLSNSYGKLFITFRLYKRIVLNIEGGYTYNRFYLLHNNDEKIIRSNETIYSEVKDGIFFGAGIAYRYRFNR